MSDLILTLRVPQTLVERAQAAHMNIEDRSAFLLETLEREIARAETLQARNHSIEEPIDLTIEEKEAELARLLPPDRLQEGLRLLHEGKPIPGLFAGKVTMHAGFDDPLPDEEWGDLFQ